MRPKFRKLNQQAIHISINVNPYWLFLYFATFVAFKIIPPLTQSAGAKWPCRFPINHVAKNSTLGCNLLEYIG